MKKTIKAIIASVFIMTLAALLLCGCARTNTEEQEIPTQTTTEEGSAEKELKLKVDGKELTVEWEDNESVSALKELAKEAPITIKMSMYGGFEQVGPIGADLPRNDVQITTQSGDIVLYSGNQIVLFYGSNSWSYTRLGKITEADLKTLLGTEPVTLTITTE